MFPTAPHNEAKNGGGGNRTREPFLAEPVRYVEKWTCSHRHRERAALETALTLRDGYGCFYCGSTAALTVDHVRPRCLGGSDELANLVWACRVCNWSKLADPAWLYAMWVVVRGPSRIRRRDLQPPLRDDPHQQREGSLLSPDTLVHDLLGGLLERSKR